MNQKEEENDGILYFNLTRDKATVLFQSPPIRFNTRCSLNYRKFPFDTIVCTVTHAIPLFIRNGSVQVRLQWYEAGPVEVQRDPSGGYGDSVSAFDAGFNISDIQTSCVETGIFCSAKFFLKRNYTFYILQVYVSSFIFVGMSYLSFFVSLNSPSRSSLCSTSIIAQVLMYQQATGSTQIVGYIRGIDVWYTGCLVFMFIPLVAYALCVFYFENEKDAIGKTMLDKIALVMYPAAFACFCSVYFSWTTS